MRATSMMIFTGFLALLVAGSTATRMLQEDGCACSLDGISGNADTGRMSCAQHAPGDMKYYCYVVDPETCETSTMSEAFPGAAWRECMPRGQDGAQAPVASSLLEIVQQREDLSLLADILEALPDFEAGLDNTETEQKVTFFAPNNRALQDAADYLGLTLQELKESDQLNAILLGHVAFGEFTLSRLGGSQRIETLSQSEFPDILVQAVRAPHFHPERGFSTQTLAIIAERVYAPIEVGSKVVSGDLLAENGVLHVVDAVLAYLPSIPNVARDYRELTTFVRALENSGLDEDLGLSCPTSEGTCSPSPFTVFAPTNSAFAKLALEYNTTVENILDLEGLRDVLLYHVSDPDAVEDPLSLMELRAGAEIEVLLTDAEPLTSSLTQETYGCFIPQLCLSRQVVSIEGAQNSARLVDTLKPIRAFNGIIHPVADVLLPPGRLVIVPSEDSSAPGSDDGANEEPLTVLTTP